MTATAPPPAAKTPLRRRRWLRRGVAALAVILLLLLVLFRPLGHWAIQRFGGGALEKLGVSGQWKSSGSLLGGLVLDDLTLTGNATAQLRSATLRHAALEYDLWALRGGGPGTVLKRLVIQDLTVELDLTKPGPPAGPPSPPRSPGKPKLPDVILPEVRIEHLTLRLRRPDGVLTVQDFSLVLDPAGPGSLSAALLELPGVPRLEKVSGVTRTSPRQLTLEQVQLWPGSGIDQLSVDLTRLASEEAAVDLQAHQGGATMKLSGTSGAWFTSPVADVKLDLAGISQETAAFWGLPAGAVQWRAGQFSLTARGPVLRPDLLESTLTLRDAGFSMQGKTVEPVTLDAACKAGAFSLTGLSAAAGGNQATATASATLPATWAEIGKVPGSLQYQIDAPSPGTLLLPEAEFSGKVAAAGTVSFAAGKLTEATAGVTAERLRVNGIPAERLAARARLAEGTLLVENLDARLNASNTLTASGKLELSGERRLALTWQADARDLGSVPVEVRPGVLWPQAGTVQSSGTASGSLTEWQTGHWRSLTAVATADITGLRLKEAALDSLRLRAEAKDGLIQVPELSVRLNAQNRLDASGSLGLEDPDRPLSGQLALRLPDIATLSPWSTAFGGPALTAGRAEVDWQGRGTLHPLAMDSAGQVSVQGLKLAPVPELLGLSATLTQNGGGLEVPGLKASAGPWRAVGSLTFDGWHFRVPQLKAYVQDQLLAELSATIPFHGGGIPQDSPLALDWKVDALDAGRLGKGLGRPLPVEGVLDSSGHFDGTLATLQGKITVSAAKLRPVPAPSGPPLEPARVMLSAEARRGRLTVSGTARQSPLQPLTLSAATTLDLPALLADGQWLSRQPVQAGVKLPPSALAFLPAWIPALRSIDGTAALDFSVSGTLGQPVWQGSASVAAREALFTSPALPTVKDLILKVRVDQRRLTLENVSVMLAGGRLQLSGGAGLANPKDPLLDLKLSAGEVLVVRDDNLSLRADAAITCRGPVSRADVRGTIDLVRGRVFKEIEFLPLSLPNSLPPPPASTTLARAGAPALPPPLDRWNFDIAIKTRDPVRLMGNVARGNAVADLKVSGSGAKPELTGKVRLQEMWLKLPFSRLTVTDGSLTFTREQPFDPQIDLTGESITGGRIVQVFVQGRALDPKVRLTSSPPLPEGEIASLLATGVTTSDLTSSGDEAAGRAAYVLLKQTYRKLFPRAPAGNDDDEPPRLSFDFSVFSSDPARRGVSAIYELTPRWRLIGRVGETGTFRGLLHYLIRFR